MGRPNGSFLMPSQRIQQLIMLRLSSFSCASFPWSGSTWLQHPCRLRRHVHEIFSSVVAPIVKRAGLFCFPYSPPNSFSAIGFRTHKIHPARLHVAWTCSIISHFPFFVACFALALFNSRYTVYALWFAFP